MKIYVITAGSYSDYQIYGVTTDPDRAEDMRRKVSCHAGFTGDEAEIEIYEDGKFPEDSYRNFDKTVPVRYWFVEIGLITGEVMRSFEFWDDSGKQIECSQSRNLNEKGTIVKNIVADTEAEAIKIAMDTRTKYLITLYNLA